MSTQIKNTLFRFVTMRAPELLEKEMTNQSFVSHPESSKENSETFDSVFLQAANHFELISKRKSLKNASQTFSATALKTREALHESQVISKEFYDFAIWLTKNRTKLTVEQIFEKVVINNGEGVVGPMPRFTPLDNLTLNQLWDNLFYQIITYKSGYVREAILSVLVADFFIRNHQSVEQTNAALQKLAQARVIMPKVIFEKEDTSANNLLMQQAIEALPVKTKVLDQELEIELMREQISAHKKSVQELKSTQKAYDKANQKAYELARKVYEATVADLYANAQTVETTVVDPVTNLSSTVTEYVNLVIPRFEFEYEPELQAILQPPLEQIALSRTSTQTSPQTISLVDQLISNNGYESFDEIITHLEQNIDQATQYVLENMASSETLMSTNGVILPVVNTIPEQVFSIAASSIGGQSSLSLMFNDSVQQADIVAADYTITFDDETTVTKTSFADAMVNDKLSVKIFLDNLSYFGKSSFVITGTLTKADGSKIQFTGNGLVQELTLGVAKIIPSDGTTVYHLRGNGKYALKAILDSDYGDTTDNTADGSVIDYIPSGFGLKMLGILDYRKVEQEVCCYVPGEVSHIENIMASEYKEKATRRLRRSENTITNSTETETEKLTDSTSTDRFEMNQETASLLAENTHYGVNAHAGYSYGEQTGTGVVTLNAGADYANDTTSEESNNQAVTHAKEVTERVLDRIVQKVKEERISKIIDEFEENNKHGFDNTKSDKHVSGVYRWIDKVYKNQIVNYGKRLMYEFMIPQPATFHNLASSVAKDEFGIEKYEKPVDPRTASSEIALLLNDDFDAKYKYWAKIYTGDIEVKPIQKIKLSKSLSYNSRELGVESKSEAIKIPEGYVTNSATIVVSNNAANDNSDYNVVVGNKSLRRRHFYNDTATINIPGHTNELSIGFGERYNYTINISYSIDCDLSKEAKEKWQLETFNTIIEAYESKLAEYNAKIADLKATQLEKVKVNPMFYRQIENNVLRKNCIEYLISHDAIGKSNLNLIKGNSLSTTHVDYDNPALESYASKIKFFEQAFEWGLMSYNFYPFYWSDKKNWVDLYNINDVNDPTFRAFLQSGMARVMVTVRPGFEEAVNWYIATGQVWNGGQIPTMGDPMFVSIVEELRELEGQVEETWETRVPTSLTVIQAGSIGLDVQGLPCDDDCADYKLFDSDGQPVLDGNGKQISTNPIVQTNAVLNNTVAGDNIGSGGPGPNPDPFAGQNQIM